MISDGEVEFVDCPECGLPAYVEHRFAVRSTEGPVPHAVTLCPQLHRLCTPTPTPAVGPPGVPTGERAVVAPAGPWDEADGSGPSGA